MCLEVEVPVVVTSAVQIDLTCQRSRSGYGPFAASGPAKSPIDPLVRLRWLRVARKCRLLLVGP
jgi:hypothetical protein